MQDQQPQETQILTVLGKRPRIPEPIPLPCQGGPMPLTRMTELEQLRQRLVTGTLTREENSDIVQAVFELPADVLPKPCELGPGESDRCSEILNEKLRFMGDPRNYSFVAEFQEMKKTHRPAKNGAAAISAVTTFPVCSREHNRNMLRTPRSTERQCAMGSQCVALKNFGFCLREFLLPEENPEIQTQSRRALDPENKACLICIREIYHTIYLSGHFNKYKKTLDRFCQYFKNEVGTKGQYLLEDCVTLLDKFSLPMVMNNFPFYETKVDSDGTKWVLEKHYGQPDF